MRTRNFFIIGLLLFCVVVISGCATIPKMPEIPGIPSTKTSEAGDEATSAALDGIMPPKGTNPLLDEVLEMAMAAIKGDQSGECREILSKEDVEHFSQPTIGHTLSALRNLTRGAELTFEAADLSKDAERMALIRIKLEQNPDIAQDEEKLKEMLEEVDAANQKISEMDFEATLNKSKAQKNVGKMILHFGIAGYFDTRANASAVKFLNCTVNTVEKIAENPAMLLEQKDLVAAAKDYITVTKLVSGNVVSQTKQVVSISSGLVSYAREHKIEMPAKEDLKEEAQKYEPEDDADDLVKG